MKQSNGSAFSRSFLRSLAALRQPLIAVVFGLAVGAVVILSCGQNPWKSTRRCSRSPF